MAAKAYSSVTIADISDAYSVFLSNETITLIGDATGAPSGSTCGTDISVFCGTEQCEQVTIGEVICPTGISCVVHANGTKKPVVLFTTTATITEACEATIPVTVDNITINKKFTIAVAKAGENGQMLYATCSTAAATASKVATLTSGTLTLKSGSVVAVKFTNENTVSSPTLNISGTGAKQIQLNGEALTSPAHYWVAGAVVTFVYDGNYWHVADGSSLSKAEEASGKADDAAKVATNYMNFSDDGLIIGNMTSSVLGDNVLIKSGGVDIRTGSVVLASFSADLIELGKNNRNATIDLCSGVAQMKNIGGDDYNRLEMWAENEIKLSTYNSVELINMYREPSYNVDGVLASIKIQNNIPWDSSTTKYGYIEMTIHDNWEVGTITGEPNGGDIPIVGVEYATSSKFYIGQSIMYGYIDGGVHPEAGGKTGFYFNDGSDYGYYARACIFHGDGGGIKFYYAGSSYVDEDGIQQESEALGFSFHCNYTFGNTEHSGAALLMRKGDTDSAIALNTFTDDSWLRLNGESEFGGVYVGSLFKTLYGMQVAGLGGGIAGQFVATHSGKHFIIRNDADVIYFLMSTTTANTWTTQRPLQIYFSNGYVQTQAPRFRVGQTFPSITDVAYSIECQGDVVCGGNMSCTSLYQSSSERFKTNIETLKVNALEKIMKSVVYKYNLKTDLENGKNNFHYGFIIERETPSEFISDNGYSVDTYSMIAFLTKAMQEQQEQIETLKQEIKNLKG